MLLRIARKYLAHQLLCDWHQKPHFLTISHVSEKIDKCHLCLPELEAKKTNHGESFCFLASSEKIFMKSVFIKIKSLGNSSRDSGCCLGINWRTCWIPFSFSAFIWRRKEDILRLMEIKDGRKLEVHPTRRWRGYYARMNEDISCRDQQSSATSEVLNHPMVPDAEDKYGKTSPT